MKTTVIRPGILVALKTSMAGGVSYNRIDLDSGKTEAELRAIAKQNGTPVPAVARWETTRTIDNPDEYDAASKARNAAVSKVRGACARTSFGLLCPEGDEGKLDAAITAAHAIADAHNAAAASTRVAIFVIKGRIAGTDEEAARAIVGEVAGLIVQMNRGIDKLDPEAIREAATRAQEMGAMLAPEQAETIGAAVEAARKAARQITKRVQKDGEIGAVVLADVQRGAIERARLAFLDLDEAPASAGQAMPVADLGRVAQLDLDEAPLAANSEVG